MQLNLIQQRIYEVRGFKIMLDFDLAVLYEVETRVLNQAIKRNIGSFPEDFMFRLTGNEWNMMSSQIVMTYPKKRPGIALPYAFTEHGVAMPASVLKSDKARQMSIAIVRAFIAMRKFIVQYEDIIGQIETLKDRVGLHDTQLSQIYDAIENLLDEKAEKQSWKDRDRIGFKK